MEESSVEALLPYERNLFLWLNDMHASYWDVFMWIYSGKAIWIPLVVSCFIIFVYKVKWKEAVLVILCAALVGLLCDQVSVGIIKPFFERLRPTHHPDFKNFVEIVHGYRGGRLGFVSAHAANGFGVVVFSSLLFRYRPYTIAITLWALITCYSRIYLGVHFITDILGGIIVGGLVGLLVYYIYIAGRQYILKIPKEDLRKPVFSRLRARFLIGTIITLVVSIAIYSAGWEIP